MTAIPNFADVPLRAGGTTADSRRLAEGRRASRLDQLTWQTPEQIPVQAAVHRRRPARRRSPRHPARHAAVPARAVPHHVRPAAVDRPPVRRLLDGQGLQRLLPPQPRRRADGPEHRLRPGDPPRLRLRPPARRRRRRHGRRGHRQHPRHAHALRRHPARQDERVDDHERRRAAGAGPVHRRRRGAGGEAGAARGDHPERHPQGVHGPQHLHLPARAEHPHHRRHLRLHQPADAEVQQHQHQRLPHAGGRGHRRPGTGLHAGRRPGVRPHRA